MEKFKKILFDIRCKTNNTLVTTKLGRIFYRFIRLYGINSNSKQNLIPKEKEHKGIPKCIYQTYKNNDLPDEIKENIKNIRKLNPSWEYRFFDDRDVEVWIRENYGEGILAYYKMINPTYGAARADLFRYLLIYKNGGVYLDIKSTLVKPLDEFIRDDDMCILTHWGSQHKEHVEIRDNHREYQQWHIIASKGHPYLKMVIENVLRNIKVYNTFFHQTGAMATLRITGPISYTNSIDSIIDKSKHRVLEGEDVWLKYSIYASKDHKILYKNSNDYSKATQPLVIKEQK